MLVGLQKRVLDYACWTQEKSVDLSLLDSGKECWTELVGLSKSVLDYAIGLRKKEC